MDGIREESAADPAGDQTKQDQKSKNKKKIMLCAAAAAVAVVVLVLFLIRPWEAKKPVYAYTSPVDGVTYTIEKLQQRAENVPGQAFLRVDTRLSVLQNSDREYWMFDFIYREMNGIALHVDRVESMYIYKNGSMAEYNQTAEDLEKFGMNMQIPANGDWTFTGGQPVQDSAVGIGTILRGTDENGAPLLVTAYIPFNP